MSDTDERVRLTFDEAVAMLPDGDDIHTFRQAAVGTLIGADWPRADILEHIAKHGAELSGEHATRMKHGICVLEGGRVPLWIATK